LRTIAIVKKSALEATHVKPYLPHRLFRIHMRKLSQISHWRKCDPENFGNFFARD
jgi:hypothetical protein